MRKFVAISLVLVAVLAVPNILMAQGPIMTLIKAKPVRSAVKGVYQSVREVRSFGSTGSSASYGSVGSNVSYGSVGSNVSYGSVGSNVSYGSAGSSASYGSAGK